MKLAVLLAAIVTDQALPAEPVAMPAKMPVRRVHTLVHNPDGYNPGGAGVATDLLLGDLLFHTPAILGPKAQQLGLSCQTCHPNGAAHTTLSIPGLTDRPGNVDVTTGHFRPEAEDGIFNPVNIPSLRGVKVTGPYGHDGRTASLAEFVQNVVTTEFGGAPLPLDRLNALVRYVSEQEFLPNRKLDSHGNLIAAQTSEGSRRGEVLFHRPFQGFEGSSCASCHVPSSYFCDGKVHRIGSGDPASPYSFDDGYETPTLLGITETAPYFHDGRFATLGDVVAWFDREFQLGLSLQEQADLTAYLDATGAVDVHEDARPMAQRMADTFAYLQLLVDGSAKDDRAVWSAALVEVTAALQGPKSARDVERRADLARRELSQLRTQVATRLPLQDLRPAIRRLQGELPRLAVDWSGSLNPPAR